MDLFKNLFQPTIVHLGNYAPLFPNGHYFLNYNVVQIDWFKNNSIILEDGSGIILLENYDENNPYTSSDNDAMFLLGDGDTTNDKRVIDIPRIYFSINNNFAKYNGIVSTPNSVNNFIMTLIHLTDSTERSIADFVVSGDTSGDDILIPGVDYFINSTFADYLISEDLGIDDENMVDPESIDDRLIQKIRSIELPNYLTPTAEINDAWIELEEDEINNTDLAHYYIINKYAEYEISDDDIKAFYVLFINGIKNANVNHELLTVKDALYDVVLTYFANTKEDSATRLISLVLGTSYSTKAIQSMSNYSCNCKNNSNSTSSCSTLYADAMLEHLKSMFGDNEFYCSFFYENDEPNIELIDYLIYIINRLKDLEIIDRYTGNNVCMPCAKNSEDTDRKYHILNNYIKVLTFVKTGSIQQNTNKIKLWGNQFGELLPQLYF